MTSMDNWYKKSHKLVSATDSLWTAYEKKRAQFKSWYNEAKISQQQCEELTKKANDEYYEKAKDLMEIE